MARRKRLFEAIGIEGEAGEGISKTRCWECTIEAGCATPEILDGFLRRADQNVLKTLKRNFYGHVSIPTRARPVGNAQNRVRERAGVR